jgi:hypothetical protein
MAAGYALFAQPARAGVDGDGMSVERHVHAAHEVSAMGAFGPFYPPYLQEAVDHAERLVELLQGLDQHAARKSAATWLVGRVEEVECLVGELTLEWRCGDMSAAETAQSVMAYVQALHRGLAINFGELAPSCCVTSLVATAPPVSFLDVTRSFPPSMAPRWEDVNSTWGEVEEKELLESTYVPGSR